MRIAARTIWDTRIQCVCGVIAAREGDHTEVYFSATFGQVTTDPPRIIINPNRLYAIEGIIRRCGRFSLNLLSARQQEEALRLIRMRRREPNKIGVLGWQVGEGKRAAYRIFRTMCARCFAKWSRVLDTGDHSVMISPCARYRGEPAARRRAGADLSGNRRRRGFTQPAHQGDRPLADYQLLAFPAAEVPTLSTR